MYVLTDYNAVLDLETGKSVKNCAISMCVNVSMDGRSLPMQTVICERRYFAFIGRFLWYRGKGYRFDIPLKGITLKDTKFKTIYIHSDKYVMKQNVALAVNLSGASVVSNVPFVEIGTITLKDFIRYATFS